MFIGLDLSLRETGFAHLYRGRFKTQVVKTKLLGNPRLDYLEETIMNLVTDLNPSGVAIEDYAMGAKGRVFNIGELGGVIRLAVYRAGIPMIEVPPTVLKKFVTGKGNANKTAMVKKVSQLWFDTDNDNVADAVALSKVAAAVFDGSRDHPQLDTLLKNCVVSNC